MGDEADGAELAFVFQETGADFLHPGANGGLGGGGGEDASRASRALVPDDLAGLEQSERCGGLPVDLEPGVFQKMLPRRYRQRAGAHVQGGCEMGANLVLARAARARP